MSSRFVPAGSESNPTVPDDAWSKAKEDVDAQRKPKPVEKQDGGKSLYEVLQQNKGMLIQHEPYLCPGALS